jgi:hypothetical protein
MQGWWRSPLGGSQWWVAVRNRLFGQGVVRRCFCWTFDDEPDERLSDVEGPCLQYGDEMLIVPRGMRPNPYLLMPPCVKVVGMPCCWKRDKLWHVYVYCIFLSHVVYLSSSLWSTSIQPQAEQFPQHQQFSD